MLAGVIAVSALDVDSAHESGRAKADVIFDAFDLDNDGRVSEVELVRPKQASSLLRCIAAAFVRPELPTLTVPSRAQQSILLFSFFDALNVVTGSARSNSMVNYEAVAKTIFEHYKVRRHSLPLQVDRSCGLVLFHPN